MKYKPETRELSCGFNDNHTKVQLDFKGEIYTIEKDIGILLIKKDNKKIFEQKFDLESMKNIIVVNFLNNDFKDFKDALVDYYTNVIEPKSYFNGSDFLYRDLTIAIKRIDNEIFSQEQTNTNTKIHRR